MEKIERVEKHSGHLAEPFAAISHMVGVSLGVAGLVILIIFSSKISALYLTVSIIYSVSMILLYASSSLYHSLLNSKAKNLLRKFDHISIFIFIAATYTPICLIPLKGKMGIYMFLAVWICALLGIVSKSIKIGKSNIVSTLLYMAMGWICVFAIIPIIKSFTHGDFVYLTLGGALYTTGAIIYMVGNIYKKRARLITHNVFHIFVLLGSISHYALIFNLVSA